MVLEFRVVKKEKKEILLVRNDNNVSIELYLVIEFSTSLYGTFLHPVNIIDRPSNEELFLVLTNLLLSLCMLKGPLRIIITLVQTELVTHGPHHHNRG